MTRCILFIALTLALASVHSVLAVPQDIGSANGAGYGGSGDDYGGCPTHVPVGPTTIVPETDFIPVNNVLPMVNVYPTDYNDYSCDYDLYGNHGGYGGYGGDYGGYAGFGGHQGFGGM
ncbi:hypothetical protein BGZ70_008671 [Mortierella alpina]|uniref:Uncharacterized protein n=1 Tax=Mortierella alpina TaxID=64518 RepID=A0A9P6J2Z8_MORAP|nr:hypothetical protein BGZ70_008671 [Mortierella alpina]